MPATTTKGGHPRPVTISVSCTEACESAKAPFIKSAPMKIKKIMAEKGMKMIEASKYIKANNISY